MVLNIIITVSLLVVNILIWMAYYGLELFINGGDPTRYGYWKYICEEFDWAFYPHTKIDPSCPGIPHFVLTHLVLPFFLPISYLIYVFWH